MMKTSIKLDLTDVQDCMEAFKRKLPNMKLAELIDVAARLKAVAKTCKLIDDACKGQVKAKCAGKPGEVKGEIFKAVLRIDTPTRLNQTKLREAEPEIFEQYSEECPTEVVTFAAR